MTSDEKKTEAFEAPLDRAVRAVAEVRAEQLQDLPRSQLGIEWLTERIGRPWLAYAVLSFVAAWIALSTIGGGRPYLDAPMFPLLQLVIGVLSLLMASFILITENRQGAIAEKRAQLTLQLCLANEERAAKIIALLEELRKDDPALPNRHDDEADQMAEAIDLRTALGKMEDADAKVADGLPGGELDSNPP